MQHVCYTYAIDTTRTQRIYYTYLHLLSAATELHAPARADDAQGLPSDRMYSLLIECVLLCQPRQNFKPLHTLTTHKDFIYSLALAGDVVLSGDGQA